MKSVGLLAFLVTLTILSGCSESEVEPLVPDTGLLEKLDRRQSLSAEEQTTLKRVGRQLVSWVLEEACEQRGPWRDGVRPNSALLSTALKETWLNDCAGHLWMLSKAGDAGAVMWLGRLGAAGTETWAVLLRDATDRWCAVDVVWNKPSVLFPLVGDQLQSLLGAAGETPAGGGPWHRSGDREGRLLAMIVKNRNEGSSPELVSLLRSAREWRRDHLEVIPPKNPGVNSLQVDCPYLSDLAMELVLLGLGSAESQDSLEEFLTAAVGGADTGSEAQEALRAVKWLAFGGVDWCGLPGQDDLWKFLECCGPRLGVGVHTIAGLASEVLAEQKHPEMVQRAKAVLLSCLKKCDYVPMVDRELWPVDAGVFDDTELRLLSELRTGALAGSRWLESIQE